LDAEQKRIERAKHGFKISLPIVESDPTCSDLGRKGLYQRLSIKVPPRPLLARSRSAWRFISLRLGFWSSIGCSSPKGLRDRPQRECRPARDPYRRHPLRRWSDRAFHRIDPHRVR